MADPHESYQRAADQKTSLHHEGVRAEGTDTLGRLCSFATGALDILRAHAIAAGEAGRDLRPALDEHALEQLHSLARACDFEKWHADGKTKCQCERVSHGDHGCPYGATDEVRTPYGRYRVCLACARECLKNVRLAEVEGLRAHPVFKAFPEATDRAHDEEQDKRATGPTTEQERRARELELEDPHRGYEP